MDGKESDKVVEMVVDQLRQHIDAVEGQGDYDAARFIVKAILGMGWSIVLELRAIRRVLELQAPRAVRKRGRQR